MPESPARLAQKLLDEGQKSLQFFRALAPEQWRQILYNPEGAGDPVVSAGGGDRFLDPGSGGWDLKDLLAHFVSAEASFGLLLQNILAGGEGAPEDFDIDRFNHSKVSRLKESNRDELLQELDNLRSQNAQLVASMQPEDLDRMGRHPFLGVAPLSDIIKLIYRHQGIHLRDVRKSSG